MQRTNNIRAWPLFIHVALPEKFHQQRRSLLQLRREQQMKVIGHQHVRVQRAAETFRELREVIQEKSVIVVSEKARLTIVPALDDVRRQTSNPKAFSAGHGSGSLSYPPAS
jgi:hypothetical protein